MSSVQVNERGQLGMSGLQPGTHARPPTERFTQYPRVPQSSLVSHASQVSAISTGPASVPASRSTGPESTPPPSVSPPDASLRPESEPPPGPGADSAPQFAHPVP